MVRNYFHQAWSNDFKTSILKKGVGHFAFFYVFVLKQPKK
jgi:hypothetical protein